MMTSSNGNISRVTCHLCGEFTVTGEFPTKRPVTRSFDVFFDLCLNKRLSKQSWGWWIETPSRPLWRHCNAFGVQWVNIVLEKKHWRSSYRRLLHILECMQWGCYSFVPSELCLFSCGRNVLLLLQTLFTNRKHNYAVIYHKTAPEGIQFECLTETGFWCLDRIWLYLLSNHNTEVVS